jgi:hypothetical protein
MKVEVKNSAKFLKKSMKISRVVDEGLQAVQPIRKA